MAYIGHAVWNVPICLCVCACYLRQLLTQLRAGGPWHQCGWREARYWRRVQPVLKPGLLEGSLTFSNSSRALSLPLSLALSLPLAQLVLFYQVYENCFVRRGFSLRSRMTWMLSVADLVHEVQHVEFARWAVERGNNKRWPSYQFLWCEKNVWKKYKKDD